MIVISGLATIIFVISIGIIVLGLSLMVEWCNAKNKDRKNIGLPLMIIGFLIIIAGIIMYCTRQSAQAYEAVLSVGSTVIGIGGVSMVKKFGSLPDIKCGAWAATIIGFILFIIFIVLVCVTYRSP